jgi:hypothetical protein
MIVIMAEYVKSQNKIYCNTLILGAYLMLFIALIPIAKDFFKEAFSKPIEIRALDNLQITPAVIQQEFQQTQEPQKALGISKSNLVSYQVQEPEVQDFAPPTYTGDPSNPIKEGREPPMLLPPTVPNAEQQPIRKEVFPLEKETEKEKQDRRCSEPTKKPVKSCVVYSSCNQKPKCRAGGLFKCRNFRTGFGGRCRLFRLRR